MPEKRDKSTLSRHFKYWADRSEQTVQIRITLLLMEQSDQALHCFLFNLVCLFLWGVFSVCFKYGFYDSVL